MKYLEKWDIKFHFIINHTDFVNNPVEKLSNNDSNIYNFTDLRSKNYWSLD